MFCREVCEVVITEESEPIGVEGKKVQIDESKIGRRKYHKGHRVSGFLEVSKQNHGKALSFRWISGIKILFCQNIQKWIMPGMLIISDCWKSYDKLKELGFGHKKVNHSEKFVSETGYHTNKTEGHWHQMKASLPTHGRRKFPCSSYRAEFV